MSDELTPAARYQRYAALRARLLTAASRRVPLVSLATQARALTLWSGKQVTPATEQQLAAVFDLGVLEPLGDHGRGIDRQARAEPGEPGSDEAKLLAALQQARFGLFRRIGPDAAGGVAAEEFPGGAPVRIWDSYLGMGEGGEGLFAARLVRPDPEAAPDFAMCCGVVVPIDSRVLQHLLDGTPPQRGEVRPRQVLADDAAAVARILDEPAAKALLAEMQGRPGFAAQLYRVAIDQGLMGPIPGRTPAEAMPRPN